MRRKKIAVAPDSNNVIDMREPHASAPKLLLVGETQVSYSSDRRALPIAVATILLGVDLKKSTSRPEDSRLESNYLGIWNMFIQPELAETTG